MSRVEVTQESAPLSDGMLQTVLPLNATSQFVKDNVGNFSAFSLSTSLVGIGTTSPLGLLHLKTTGATTRMVIDGDAGQNRIITYRTSGLQRFGLYVNNTAESGSNVGSDFAIRAYNDAGTLLSTPLFIKRSTQNVGIGTTTGTARLTVKGSGSSSATTSLLVQNSAGTAALTVLDDLSLSFGNATVSQIRAGNLIFNSNGLSTTNGGSAASLSFSSANYDFTLNKNLTLQGGKLTVVGSGSTSATTSLLVQNSASTELFKIQDDGTFSFGNGSLSLVNVVSSSSALRIDSGGVNGVIRLQGNQIGMGDNTTGNASALLTLTSTTKGFLPPKMTTVEKNLIPTPAAGLVVYDTTLNKLCVRTVATWETITSV